jgi:hypothetical protein
MNQPEHRPDWRDDAECFNLTASARYALFKAEIEPELAKKREPDYENPRNRRHGGQRKMKRYK